MKIRMPFPFESLNSFPSRMLPTVAPPKQSETRSAGIIRESDQIKFDFKPYHDKMHEELESAQLHDADIAPKRRFLDIGGILLARTMQEDFLQAGINQGNGNRREQKAMRKEAEFQTYADTRTKRSGVFHQPGSNRYIATWYDPNTKKQLRMAYQISEHGKEKALALANAKREEMEKVGAKKHLPIRQDPDWQDRPKKTGVTYSEHNGKWIAGWTDKNSGKWKSEGYKVSEHTAEGAYNMACAKRIEMEALAQATGIE